MVFVGQGKATHTYLPLGTSRSSASVHCRKSVFGTLGIVNSVSSLKFYIPLRSWQTQQYLGPRMSHCVSSSNPNNSDNNSSSSSSSSNTSTSSINVQQYNLNVTHHTKQNTQQLRPNPNNTQMAPSSAPMTAPSNSTADSHSVPFKHSSQTLGLPPTTYSNSPSHSTPRLPKLSSPNGSLLVDATNQPMQNYDGTEMRDERGRLVYKSQFLSTHPLKGDCKERVGYGKWIANK